MKKTILYLLLLVLTPSIISCGKLLDGDVEDKAQRFANYLKSFRKELLELSHAAGHEHPSFIKPCSAKVVADHNSIYLKCNFAIDSSDIDTCLGYIKLFKSKYPEINCYASNGYGLDEGTTRINKYYIDRLLKNYN